MNSNSKDRIKLALLIIPVLLVLASIVLMLNPNRKEAGMTIPSLKVVKAENTQEIERNKKYHEPYVIKAQENNKFYLKYYEYKQNDELCECKYELTSDQYNKLAEDGTYWISVNFSKLDDETSGIVKKIYTYDPRK